MGKRGNAIRCPKCNRFGSNDLGGYCKKCYAQITLPVVEVKPVVPEGCTKCGKAASRVNDEYIGCVPYPLCEACYIDKFGFALKTDFPLGNEPPCVQCGEPAFKMERDNAYCLRHFRDRNEDFVDPERKHFRAEFGLGDKPFITEDFSIVKDKFGVEGKW